MAVEPSALIRRRQQWLRDRGYDPAQLAGMIIAVASSKGGVGKTFCAMELAYLLGGILLDWEWDDGSSSVALGYNPDERDRSILLTALKNGTPPRFIKEQKGKPALIPGHKDFELYQPTADDTMKLIQAWARYFGEQFGVPLIVDCHPGGGSSTRGSIAAANVTVIPLIFEERPMRAFEGQVREYADYNLLPVPNMVNVPPPGVFVDWLQRIADDYELPVAPPIRHYQWLASRRSGRSVVCSVDGKNGIPKKAEGVVEALQALAEEAVKSCLETE